ncbi:MAG TPA: LLM class F420-dependent oxidoreductase [Candidatus Binataceae bacterium]|nr:LLM class F420-dependent oxidoreductase [Candidatus Binataceae bacterium]
MKIGISMIYKRVDDSAPNPGDFARECEQMGLESVWVGDHMLFHGHPTTKFPIGSGRIPDHYAHFPEPFIVLAMAAATTQRLRIGTSVLLAPEHPPLPTAKRVATLDRLTNGRVILGVGAGWLREAAIPLGSDFDHRWSQAEEHVQAMRELWSKPAASFHGRWVNFDDIVVNPKPVQQPGPPILIGSTDKRALRWVARWGDGYNPVCFETDKAVDYLRRKLAELREECDKVGRNFSKLDVTAMVSLPDDRARVQELIGQMDELGVGRIVEVSAIEPLFGVGDWRAKLERLGKIAL